MASAMEGVLVTLSAPFVCVLLTLASQIKPIEGAESEGAFGFFKGVGKGIVGYMIIIHLCSLTLTDRLTER